MRRLQELYFPDEEYEYDVFYLRQSNSIRYLRDHDNPGKSYGSALCVMVREEERYPGFKQKVKEIKKQVQSEADNWEPVDEVERLLVIVQALGDEFSDMGYVFFCADVGIMHKDGTVETMEVQPE